MRISKLSILLGALFAITLCLYFVGCYTKIQENNKPDVIPQPSSQAKDRLTVITPSKTDYTGSSREIKRDVKIWGIANPFEVSPGEVISNMEPLKLEEKDLPGMDLTENGGLSVTKGAGAESSSGGFRWTFMDSIMLWGRKILWFGIIGIIALVAIFFLVPGAQPIIAIIGRMFASFIPFVGSIVERLSAKFKWQEPLKQTVTACDEFKNSINNSSDLSAKQKTRIIELFRYTMMSKQDKVSQNTIDKIRILNK